MPLEYARCKPVTQAQSDRFKKLCWPYLPDLLRVALFLTHRRHAAEDVVQETMLKALRAIDSFEAGTDVKAWLMTILRRAHIDATRRAPLHGRLLFVSQVPPSNRRPSGDVRADAPGLTSVRDGGLEEFDDPEIVTALRSLPVAIRWTLLLVDVEEMSHSEAASILGVPVGTIKSRAHRGHAMLREELPGHARRYQLVA